MCLTVFCLNPEADSPLRLILGFNRQEQTLRSTLPLAPYQEDSNIIGGRDIKSGGTWLGLNKKTGLLVMLTNYDLPKPRVGKSRGKLVHRLLSSDFLPEHLQKEGDAIIQQALHEIAKEGQQYSAFNLTVYNIRSGRMYYLCSEWAPQRKFTIEENKSYGICNCDIETTWPKTAHALTKFNAILSSVSKLSQSQRMEQIETLFKDKVRFSAIDDDEASIFVEPYWCVLEKAERMTKSTFVCLLTEKEGHLELEIRQISYQGKEAVESRVEMTIQIEK